MKQKNKKNSATLISLIIFELTSFYGRNLKRSRNNYIKNKDLPLLLDLGVGLNYKDEWVNIDFYRLPRLKFWKRYKERPLTDLELDLRFPLPYTDNIADGVYSGHTLEHLSLYDAKNLLNEIYRVLKPECWLRINVPDLEKYIDFYCGKNQSEEFMTYNTGCEAIHALTQNWGHQSCWDLEFLKRTLEEIGFVNTKKVSFGTEGSDKRLINEEKVREWETLVMEAQKPKI